MKTHAALTVALAAVVVLGVVSSTPVLAQGSPPPLEDPIMMEVPETQGVLALKYYEVRYGALTANRGPLPELPPGVIVEPVNPGANVMAGVSSDRGSAGTFGAMSAGMPGLTFPGSAPAGGSKDRSAEAALQALEAISESLGY